ncbi:GAF domain-containing protein [Streptomyces sp. RB6PN25]|uniref:GAF domain-containing protein n=1 Tax=Streptomyces humicola TaxID=2953240 RepID=A0ABT1Q4N5_9ACTN|nr:GAF domain-containing protein [Streptomyces humicola]MCQ4084849.1 GAF domain-containing protein [Streptomyces humicola]
MTAQPYNPPPGPEGGIATRHLLLPPEDLEVRARAQRLRELGITDRPVPEFDDFARELARRTGGCYAGVNFFLDENRQYFAGLYSVASDTTVRLDSPLLADPVPGRVMPRDLDLGFCPHVVRRRKALVLEDVRDFPRFAGNYVIDAIGIHSYLGAPLIDRTGMALGTICVVDQDPRPWGRQGLETIKTMAAQLMERIQRSEHRSGGSMPE